MNKVDVMSINLKILPPNTDRIILNILIFFILAIKRFTDLTDVLVNVRGESLLSVQQLKSSVTVS